MEFHKALTGHFGYRGSPWVLDEVFKSIDTDGSGEIGFDELFEVRGTHVNAHARLRMHPCTFVHARWGTGDYHSLACLHVRMFMHMYMCACVYMYICMTAVRCVEASLLAV